MFKLPDFPSVDFSKFDVDALRNIDVSKYVPAVNFPKVDLPDDRRCRPSTSPSSPKRSATSPTSPSVSASPLRAGREIIDATRSRSLIASDPESATNPAASRR